MLRVDPDDTPQQLDEIAANTVIVPPEPGLAAVVQLAADKTPAKPTLAELTAQLPRPLAHFLAERVAAGHMLSNEVVAEILRDNTEDLMPIESTVLLLEYFLDRATPEPGSDTWVADMKLRSVMEEYLRYRLKSVHTLPHLRPKPKPAP